MDNIRHYHIKFNQGPAKGSKNDWETGLLQLGGIITASIDTEKEELVVSYDLLECKIEDIEKWMTETGFVLDDNFMQRLKRGWTHFKEENEQANLKTESAPCCDYESVRKRRMDVESEKKPGE